MNKYGLYEDFECFNQEPSYHVGNSLNATLPHAHYSNTYWNKARLVWGQEGKCRAVNYSDRMWQWDYTAAQNATETCRNAGAQHNTALWVQTWLSAYHGTPVTLRYIMMGCNVLNGFDYAVYGYDY